jgi:tetratricopeptide (TPR) repeat protein
MSNGGCIDLSFPKSISCLPGARFPMGLRHREGLAMNKFVLTHVCIAGQLLLCGLGARAQDASDLTACVSSGAGKDNSKTISLCSLALDRDKEPSRRVIAYQVRAATFKDNGDYDKSIADYTQAIAIEPKAADHFLNRGSVYERKGDKSKAISDYSEAIKIDPKRWDAYFKRGSVYCNLGEYNLAVANFDKVIELYPTSFTYKTRGDCWSKKGDDARARADFTKSIDLEAQGK